MQIQSCPDIFNGIYLLPDRVNKGERYFGKGYGKGNSRKSPAGTRI